MSISKPQQSVLAIIGGVLVVTLISRNYIFLVVAGALALTLPFSAATNLIHRAWMHFSNLLGWISRHVILFILFYLFLTPFAFLLRLFGKQTILTRRRNEKSFFTERNHIYGAEDFTNPW